MDEIGGYRLLEQIGESVAVVYRAVQPSVNREIALKVLPPRLESDREAVLRFQREAEVAGRLRHDHIVKVLAASVETPPYWIAFDFLDGGTLGQRLSSGPLPVEEAARVAAAVCDALDHAHERGVVHRDVKPRNIMFDADGRPFVTDFGVARVAGQTALTETGQQPGTPFYMSPEQVNGLAVDRRSDVFSLGAVLYEMVTGRTPFGSDDRLAVQYRIVHEEPAPPEMYNPSLSAALRSAILTALMKDPAQRFQTAAEMSAALRGLPHTLGEQTSGPPGGGPWPARPGSTREIDRPGELTGPGPWKPAPRARPRPRAAERWRRLLRAGALAAALAGLGGAFWAFLSPARRGFGPPAPVLQGDRSVVCQTDAILSQTRPPVQLVRYYEGAREGAGGEFGSGWRLLLPYRLSPSKDTRMVEDVSLPNEVVVEDLLAGTQERFSFGTDNQGWMGYFPPRGSRHLGVYLMSDGCYLLKDTRGRSYHFDREGRLIVVDAHPEAACAYSYEAGRLVGIWALPLGLVPDERTRQAVGEISLPLTITVVDQPHPEQLVLGENEFGAIGYYPKNTARWKALHILGGATFRLEDRWGNIYDFDEAGEFVTARMAASLNTKDLADAPAIRLIYNRAGHIVEAHTGPKGRVAYLYNRRNRLIERIGTSGDAVVYRYTRDGRVLAKEVRREPPGPGEGSLISD